MDYGVYSSFISAAIQFFMERRLFQKYQENMKIRHKTAIISFLLMSVRSWKQSNFNGEKKNNFSIMILVLATNSRLWYKQYRDRRNVFGFDRSSSYTVIK